MHERGIDSIAKLCREITKLSGKEKKSSVPCDTAWTE
jgi:hypothetical protein